MESLIRGQMGPLYFPVPYEALSARITYQHLDQGHWEHDGVRMRSMRMRHTASTVGYRVEAFGKSVAFIPDNELVGGDYPVPTRWMDDLIDFISGADLLFHDAMYTEEEYRSREGWGHSTFTQVLELAAESGVKRLQFFHHHPARTDQELDDIVQRFREAVAERGLDVQVDAASESSVLTLGDTP
jgi:ribonuclease BN (tRNA processing enzyme)